MDNASPNNRELVLEFWNYMQNSNGAAAKSIVASLILEIQCLLPTLPAPFATGLPKECVEFDEDAWGDAAACSRFFSGVFTAVRRGYAQLGDTAALRNTADAMRQSLCELKGPAPAQAWRIKAAILTDVVNHVTMALTCATIRNRRARKAVPPPFPDLKWDGLDDTRGFLFRAIQDQDSLNVPVLDVQRLIGAFGDGGGETERANQTAALFRVALVDLLSHYPRDSVPETMHIHGVTVASLAYGFKAVVRTGVVLAAAHRQVWKRILDAPVADVVMDRVRDAVFTCACQETPYADMVSAIVPIMTLHMTKPNAAIASVLMEKSMGPGHPLYESIRQQVKIMCVHTLEVSLQKPRVAVWQHCCSFGIRVRSRGVWDPHMVCGFIIMF